MANRTAIEWTDITTAVGVYGCKSASPACRYCYAAAMAIRLAAMPHTAERYAGVAKRVGGRAVFTGTVRCDVDLLEAAMAKLPKGLKRCGACGGLGSIMMSSVEGPASHHECGECGGAGRRKWRCFPANMTDLFHPDVPFEFIAKVFAHFEARPHIVFQVLSKRAQRMAEWSEWAKWSLGEVAYTHASLNLDGSIGLGGSRKQWRWPSNVWAGTTVEDQQRADERIPWLLKVPAAVRFLSMEPLLGPVDLRHVAPMDDWWTDALDTPDPNYRVHWIISGGESGPHARPSHPDWHRGLRDQCAAAGVPFFMKQHGAWVPRVRGVGTFDTLAKHDRDRLVDQAGYVHCIWEVAGPDAAPMSRVGRGGDPKTLDGVKHREFPS